VVGFALYALFRQLWVSIRDRELNRVPAGDPWNGRSLEWAMAAPPPEYNFAVQPTITAIDAFHVAKATGHAYRPAASYADIELPKSSMMGIMACVMGFLIAFGLVWHIWWMAGGGMLVVIASMIARGFTRNNSRTIKASEVARQHHEWLAKVAATTPIDRDDETDWRNRGLALVTRNGGAS
jgi:cytochrome o ubiquinol oxidase subunit 1